MGLICGNVALEIGYRNQKWLKTSTIRMIMNALGLVASAIAVHAVVDKLTSKSGGANWTVAKAEKWCKKADWVYIDTTPYYALVILVINLLIPILISSRVLLYFVIVCLIIQ